MFGGDDAELVPVKNLDLGKLPREIRRLYEDFAIIDKKRTYLCPENFNILTVSWYLNESENPNVGYDKAKCDFYALRDIRSGEELTVDYNTYSEKP